MSGWKPIATAPKDGTRLLVCQSMNNITAVAIYHDDIGTWKTGPGPMDFIAGVTHWYDFGDGKAMPDAPEVG